LASPPGRCRPCWAGWVLTPPGGPGPGGSCWPPQRVCPTPSCRGDSPLEEGFLVCDGFSRRQRARHPLPCGPVTGQRGLPEAPVRSGCPPQTRPQERGRSAPLLLSASLGETPLPWHAGPRLYHPQGPCPCGPWAAPADAARCGGPAPARPTAAAPGRR